MTHMKSLQSLKQRKEIWQIIAAILILATDNILLLHLEVSEVKDVAMLHILLSRELGHC